MTVGIKPSFVHSCARALKSVTRQHATAGQAAFFRPCPKQTEETANRFMKSLCISFAGKPCLRQASGLGATENSVSHRLGGRDLYATPCPVKTIRVLFAHRGHAARNRPAPRNLIASVCIFPQLSAPVARVRPEPVASCGESWSIGRRKTIKTGMIP